MLGWFRRLMPREDKFFDLFEALRKLLDGGEGVERYCHEIIALENDADAITHDVLTAVRKSFITPFDRGDIKDLIQSMDDAIDMMRKTVKTVILFECKEFDPLMREMGAIIVEASRLTAKSVPLLANVSANATQLGALAEEVMRIEERADEMHDQGLKELFHKYGRSDPMAYMIGSELYSELEKVVDRLEDVANEISGIVIENV